MVLPLYVQRDLKMYYMFILFNYFLCLAKKESAMLKGKTEEKLAIWPVFRKRLDNMKTQYVHSCTKLKRFHEEVQRRQENLKRGTKSRIIQLRHHVFPVEEVNQGNRSGSKG